MEAAAVERAVMPQSPDPLPVPFIAALVVEAVGADVRLGQLAVADFQIVAAGDGELADAIHAFAFHNAVGEGQVQAHVLPADVEALEPEPGPLSAGKARVGFDLDLGRGVGGHRRRPPYYARSAPKCVR